MEKIFLIFVSIFLNLNFVYSNIHTNNIFNLIITDNNTVSRIKKDGYKVEEHTVQTTDGYILTMHRIPSLRSTKPPIYLQHGFLESSSIWILTGSRKGPAYILSDAGYDVWMGNSRGNAYSRKHAWLDPDSGEYWNFSWHEIGLFDVSAMTDYVLNKTGRTKLQYIGHSQGTTAFFVLTSIRSEYNNKFLSMHALAPVAFMENARSPAFLILSPILGNNNLLVDLLGSGEFKPSSKFQNTLGSILCRDHSPIQEMCANVMLLIYGYNYNNNNLNKSLIPDIIATVPAGSSVNQLIHFVQVYTKGKFRMFDHGTEQNEIVYGKSEPPEYNLSKISTPVALYYGDKDWLAAVRDVYRLSDSLGNSKILHKVKHWNHVDFLWAINAKKYLYDKLLKHLEFFQNHDN